MQKRQSDESDDEHEDGHHNGDSGSDDDPEDDDPILGLSDSEDDEVQDSEETDDDNDDEGATALAESMRLSLPSNTKQSLANSVLTSLRKQEAALREGQINDSLRKLRLSLGDKAWMLRNTVRDAPGGKEKLRAWSGVKTKDKEVRRHVKQYTQASAALRRMGMGAQWKSITKEDLKMPGDITEANRTGQRSSVLAWFWRLEDGEAVGEMARSGQMGECRIALHDYSQSY